MWQTKRNRHLERELRNVDLLYIHPHRFATLKRLALLNFPSFWNLAGNEKNNPRQHLYIKPFFYVSHCHHRTIDGGSSATAVYRKGKYENKQKTFFQIRALYRYST
jgi:hypothetical protein